MVKPTGIEIEPFRSSIEKAASAYSDFETPVQGGLLIPPLEMDADALLDLERVNEEAPFPLISSSAVSVEGEEVGDLTLVAIGPEQLIGDLATSPDDSPHFSTDAGAYGLIPILGESTIHIPFSTHKPSGHPFTFLNNLDLVSVRAGQMSRVGTLGQSYRGFLGILANGWFAELQQPRPSFTTAPNLNGSAPKVPNAVYNPHPQRTQLSGFLALNSWLSGEQSTSIERFAALPPRA